MQPRLFIRALPNQRLASFVAFFFLILKPHLATAEAPRPVQVFILAGQSNMEGHGVVAADPKRNDGKGSLEYLVKEPATAQRFKHLVARDGKWVVRDDVWVWYLGRTGGLRPGFGFREGFIRLFRE